MTFPIILSIALGVLGIILAFFKRLPAPVVSFLGMLTPNIFGDTAFMSGTLWFWGVATVIVTATMYMSEIPPVKPLRLYTLGGALTGTVVGAALTNPHVGVIVGGFFGAILGFVAFRGTPGGKINAGPAQILSIFADVALPGFTAFCISVITLSTLL